MTAHLAVLTRSFSVPGHIFGCQPREGRAGSAEAHLHPGRGGGAGPACGYKTPPPLPSRLSACLPVCLPGLGGKRRSACLPPPLRLPRQPASRTSSSRPGLEAAARSHESHQSGAVGPELLRSRLLPLRPKPGHRPGEQQRQEPRPGGAHEPPLRHERLLLQAARARAGHPAGHQSQPGGDPAARHRLHLRPPDRLGRAGEERAGAVCPERSPLLESSRAGLRTLLKRRAKSVPLTPQQTAGVES